MFGLFAVFRREGCLSSFVSVAFPRYLQIYFTHPHNVLMANAELELKHSGHMCVSVLHNQHMA